MRRGLRWLKCGALTMLLLGGPAAIAARAADYVLGSDDVIALSVWRHPELERKVAIDSDGNIIFPPIGSLKAAGITTAQLSDRIADRLSSYLRETVTVTVTVAQYMSQSVYVQGAVGAPGRYGFERIPGLVDVLNGAGGGVPGADLTRVQILRKEGDARRIIIADVATSLREGTGGGLPDIKPGDTIVVPSFAGAFGAVPGDAAAVIGEVAKPGLYSVSGGMNLWMLLAQAGGITGRGDLTKVRVIKVSADGQQVTSLNLKEILQHGGGAPTLVQRGDVIVVTPTGASGFARTWGGFTQLLAVSRDVANIILISDAIKHRSTP
jgi:polysaccharide export outer membrane protein